MPPKRRFADDPPTFLFVRSSRYNPEDWPSLLQNSSGLDHVRSGTEIMEKTVVIPVASLFLFAAASVLAAGQTTSSTSAVTGTTKNWPKGTPASVGLDEETLKNLDA